MRMAGYWTRSEMPIIIIITHLTFSSCFPVGTDLFSPQLWYQNVFMPFITRTNQTPNVKVVSVVCMWGHWVSLLTRII